jgi:RPA family protein
MGQSNALKKAESYSRLMHMSKRRLYDQLTSEYGEGFTAEEAQYAIDNINADWKANALETAKSYQKNLNMSKSRIYQQLTSEYGEKFTAEEAQYAIDNLED